MQLKTVLALLVSLGSLALPLQAQPKNAVLNRLVQKMQARSATPLKSFQSTWQKVIKKIQKSAAEQVKKAPSLQPQQTVFLLQDAEVSDKNPFFASGFLIQETFQGKQYLWGVTAKHITDLYDTPFEAVFYINGQPLRVPVQAVYTGAQHGIDLTLLQLQIPPAAPLVPLTLGHNPHRGDILHSYGYTRGIFYPSANRQALAVTPQKIMTPYAFVPHHPTAGYCGSPLLNTQGEVAAIHCGSAADKSASFAVPVSQLYTLLAAYRGLPQGQTPLVFNGTQIGFLHANQTIMGVYAQKNGKTISKNVLPLATDIFSALPKETELIPTQLETSLHWQGADEIYVLVFEEPPHYFLPQEEPCLQTLYRYNLSTGEVSSRSFCSLLPVL